ncbi:MAG: glycerol-3-phosphate 1-O-acyltransferase PlsY [Planctomycetota bacterium]
MSLPDYYPFHTLTTVWVYYLSCISIGYLIGSIPFGYILVKLIKGIDIRTIGSGNIGATNVARVLGVQLGIICFILDMTKGFICTRYIAMWIAPLFMDSSLGGTCSVILPDYGCGIFIGGYYIPVELFIGLSVIIGHLFPVYLRFKGGKGVATALGVFLVLMPKATLISFAIWIMFVLVLRYISVASIMAAISLPLSYCYAVFARPISFRQVMDWREKGVSILFFAIMISLLVIFKHITNIKRLIAGTEPKVRLWGTKPQIKTDEHK